MAIEAKKTGLLLIAALLGACSGGSGTQVAGIDRGGAREGIAVGAVTGLGSIFVNGVRYTTDSAAVVIDGNPAPADSLTVGQIVFVQADLSAATPAAISVSTDSNVAGPVDSIDAATGEMVVLGQSVRVTAETWVGAELTVTGLAGLAAGDRVRISGMVDAGDRILATRLERISDTSPYEIQAIARSVDAARQRLRLGQLVVDYSTASVLEGFPDGRPRDGDLVRVSGDRLGPDGELLATRLLRRPLPLAGNAGAEAEVEGFVQALLSASEFIVAGVPVRITAATDYENGTGMQVQLDDRIEVEGHLDADGVLVAEEIEFEHGSDIYLEATVSGVDAAAGVLQVFDISVEAGSTADLDALRAGDCVKVSGFESLSQPGRLVATRLEREDHCGTSLLRGRVQQVADPQLTIFGIAVLTDGGTDFPGGSAAAFFADALGRVVEAKGQQVGGALLAEQLEFKD